MKILITGCAGFIGYHLTVSLLSKKNKIYGIDNLNNYYSVKLKKDRLKNIEDRAKNNKFFFKFKKIDISDFRKLNIFFQKNKFDVVVNLAAQAGIRFSIKKPSQYLKSNVIGFFNLIDLSKNYKIKNFIYASTSSVYGMKNKMPFKENINTDFPLQFYAATKKSNEVIAHSYSSLFNLPTIGLRFFTVYGPWGRPDMAYFKFTKKIINREFIEVYNYGKHSRDFTYIDDVVNSLKIIIKKGFLNKNRNKDNIPYLIYNLGNNLPLKLKNLIKYLETYLKIKSKKKYLSLQDGDVLDTRSNSKKIIRDYNLKFKIKPKKGLENFVKWFKKYHKIR